MDKDAIRDFVQNTWQQDGPDLIACCDGDYDMALDGFKDDHAAMRLFDHVGWKKYDELKPILEEILQDFPR